MNIPLVHIQGGEVTGSIDEKVRHAMTKLADLHLVSTEQAASGWSAWARIPTRVHVTGCPSIDLAAEVLADPALNFDRSSDTAASAPPLDLVDGYLVVMQHPVTTEHEQARRHVERDAARVCAARHARAVVLAQRRRGLRRHVEGHPQLPRAATSRDNIHFFKNMQPKTSCGCSTTAAAWSATRASAIRECSFLGVPAVNIGSRQEGRDRGGNVIDVDYNRMHIVDAIRAHLKDDRPASSPLYGDGHAGHRIAELLATVPLTIEKRMTF